MFEDMSLPADLVALPTMPFDARPADMPLDVEECRTALWLHRGNITMAANTLKVSSIRLRNFVQNSPRLSREVNEAREQLQDQAEDVIYEALSDTTDPSRRDSAAKFVLTNLGASRGFGQKNASVNLNMPKGGKMTISWDDGTSIGEDQPPTIEGEVVNG